MDVTHISLYRIYFKNSKIAMKWKTVASHLGLCKSGSKNLAELFKEEESSQENLEEDLQCGNETLKAGPPLARPPDLPGSPETLVGWFLL